jgi:hypothetical protein
LRITSASGRGSSLIASEGDGISSSRSAPSRDAQVVAEATGLAPGEQRLSRCVNGVRRFTVAPGRASSWTVPVGFLWARRNRHITVPLEDRMATTHTTTAKLTVKIVANDRGNPPGELADAELHFNDGPLEGLKLIGFAIWERRSGAGRNVTFPARQYSVNVERRSFALLRPIVDASAQERVRELILEAYAEHETAASSEA